MPSDFFPMVLPGLACRLPADFCQLQMANWARGCRGAGVLTFAALHLSLCFIKLQLPLQLGARHVKHSPSVTQSSGGIRALDAAGRAQGRQSNALRPWVQLSSKVFGGREVQ